MLPARQPPTAFPPAYCRACGVCCHSSLETYVRVTGDDWTRLGAEAERVAHFIGHRAYLRMEAGRCIALRVGRDAAGQPDFFCTLYERRPQACRDLDRGSPACAGEIASKAARVHERGKGGRPDLLQRAGAA